MLRAGAQVLEVIDESTDIRIPCGTRCWKPGQQPVSYIQRLRPRFTNKVHNSDQIELLRQLVDVMQCVSLSCRLPTGARFNLIGVLNFLGAPRP